MTSLSVAIDANPDKVWAALADFGNIYLWNPGVKHSALTSDVTSGPGTARYCDLRLGGRINEVVTDWEPGRAMTVAVSGGAAGPVASAQVRLAVRPTGTDSSEASVEFSFTPGLGAVGRAMRPVLHRQLTAGMRGLLAGLKDHVETGRTDAPARDLPLSAVRGPSGP